MRSRGTDADYSLLPRAGWPDMRKVLGNRPVPQSLNVPKSLYQSPSGTSGSCDFQLASSNRSFHRSLALLSSTTKMRPFLSWEVLPLDLGHGSTAQDQRAELVHQPILIAWVVVAKILLESFEELALPILLAFWAEPYERRNRLAHTGVDGVRVPFHLAGDGRREADSVSCWRAYSAG
jgi:hypothetical protein